jgi:hypothetical protein
MTAAELIAAVQRAIGALAPAYQNAATEAYLYEAALFAAALQAAERAGGVCLLTTDGRNAVSELTFRRGPGNLWSGNYAYALVSFAGSSKRLEIHLAVFVVGASGVPHEADIALVDAQEAERSRRARIHPRRSGLIAGIEAKHYAVSPGIGIGRSFLGLSAELGQIKCSLAFPAKSDPSLATLIARKPSEAFDEVIPESAAEDRLQSHLDQAIRNWLA